MKLLPEAMRLIERYRSEERSALFAPIAYSAYLAQLKALQLRAGISILLSAHVARHSFGTLTLEAGIPIESIAKMMGYSSIASTQIYAQITDQKIAMDMDRLMQQRSM